MQINIKKLLQQKANNPIQKWDKELNTYFPKDT